MSLYKKKGWLNGFMMNPKAVCILIMHLVCFIPAAGWSSQDDAVASDHEVLTAIIGIASGHIRHNCLQHYVMNYPKDPEGHAYLGLDYVHNQYVLLSGAPAMTIGEIGQSEKFTEEDRLSLLLEAERCFQTFIKLAPQERDRAACYRSIVELYRYNYTSTISILKPRIDRSLPSDRLLRVQELFVLAAAYREMRDVKNSMKYYRMLDEENYPIVSCLIALTHFIANDLQEAICSFEKSRFEDPEGVYGEMLKAVKCEQAHEKEKAIGHYKKAHMKGYGQFSYHFTTRHLRERIDLLERVESIK